MTTLTSAGEPRPGRGDEPADPLCAAFPGVAGAPVRALVAISGVLERRGVRHGPLRPMREALAREITGAREALAAGDLGGATRSAGRVHVLGSFYAIPHAYSHIVHLRVDLARGDAWGVAVQALRLVGTPFTRPIVPFFGVTGHPGTSERAAGTRWPIEPELQALLDAQPRPARPIA
jgi:hypothetical protein